MRCKDSVSLDTRRKKIRKGRIARATVTSWRASASSLIAPWDGAAARKMRATPKDEELLVPCGPTCHMALRACRSDMQDAQPIL